MFAPEFAGTPDLEVSKWLTVASAIIDVSCLSTEQQNMAIALYAAHLLKLSVSSSTSGSAIVSNLISEKEGDLERRYGNVVMNSSSTTSQTSYGRQFDDLIAPCAGVHIMTGVCYGS
jgi:hypothetical protein